MAGWFILLPHANHIGISFPSRTIMQVFEKELASYKTSKSTIQFSYNKPLPIALIKKMVVYKMKENKQ